MLTPHNAKYEIFFKKKEKKEIKNIDPTSIGCEIGEM